MSEGSSRAFWVIVFALLLLTRIPAASEFFSIDNINLAFALEDFDLLNHQPQPPGYPFFVVFARALNVLVRNQATTFLTISVIVSGLCLPLMVAVGERLFSKHAGQAAALLLLVNPVFWHSGLDGPLRPNLALFSLLSAYCAWRAWNRESRFVLWGAVALGIGSGVRPDLLAYVGPLWLISAVVGSRSLKVVSLGSGILASIVAVWAGLLAISVGGIGVLFTLIRDYLTTQSAGGSLALGAPQDGWGHQMSRLIAWNGPSSVGLNRTGFLGGLIP